ncbi:MAG: methyltransferase domain-containing protein [Methanomassiliicoccales archaeon]
MVATHRVEIGNVAFWNNWASRENESRFLMNELTEKQLQRIAVNQEDSILEIGPGSGRLTIPIAKIAKKITVIEPSENMLSYLRVNADKENLRNIVYINKSWEEVVIGKDVKQHDIVLASFSILMCDLRETLSKINRAAKKVVYIFASADDWMPEEIQRIVYGKRIMAEMTDHVIIFNMLSLLGIRTNVEIFDYLSKRRFTNFEEAVSDFMSIYNIPENKSEMVKQLLKRKLVSENGELLFLRKKKVAMIWWRHSY